MHTIEGGGHGVDITLGTATTLGAIVTCSLGGLLPTRSVMSLLGYGAASSEVSCKKIAHGLRPVWIEGCQKVRKKSPSTKFGTNAGYGY